MVSSHFRVAATVDPSLADNQIIKGLIKSGMNVARFDFSSGYKYDYRPLFKMIRDNAKKQKRQVEILQELNGQTPRLARIDDWGIQLDTGETVAIAASKDLSEVNLISSQLKILPLDVDELNSKIKIGSYLFLEGGKVRLRVDKLGKPWHEATVISGGKVYSHSRIYIPGVSFDGPVLKDRDIEDLDFGLENGVDTLAIWLGGDETHLPRVRQVVDHRGYKDKVNIFAKMQSMSDFLNRGKIISAADGIIIDTVSLDMEIPASRLGMAQQYIIANCQLFEKPYIVI